MTDQVYPLVVAHRGSSDSRAEHTLAAYQQAIAEGADALECDVRLTADGILVCVHDRRIDRTSDGRGVVSAKTYAELAGQDYGSWKQGVQSDDPAEVDQSLHGLLRLDELIALVLEADRPIDLSIETKHPVRYGGLVERRLLDELVKADLTRRVPGRPRVRVMSFSETAVRRVREIEPSVPTVLLMDRVPVRARSGYLPAGARIAGPSIDIIRKYPEYVKAWKSAGAGVHVWTVNAPADIELCLQLGVDAIITNRPLDVIAARTAYLS